MTTGEKSKGDLTGDLTHSQTASLRPSARTATIEFMAAIVLGALGMLVAVLWPPWAGDYGNGRYSFAGRAFLFKPPLPSPSEQDVRLAWGPLIRDETAILLLTIWLLAIVRYNVPEARMPLWARLFSRRTDLALFAAFAMPFPWLLNEAFMPLVLVILGAAFRGGQVSDMGFVFLVAHAACSVVAGSMVWLAITVFRGLASPEESRERRDAP